jgi:purine nucleosidase
MSSDLSVCDEGIHEVDDGYVLGYALETPGVELLGYVASFGNTTSLNAYNCAQYLLELADRSDIPVFRGAEGVSERWEVTEAVRGMQEIVSAHPDEVWIVTTGTTTDLAGFIKNFPEDAKKTAGLLVMAGVIYQVEGILPLDVINLLMDILSADYVLENGNNLVIAPLDLTEDVVFPYELWEEGMETAESPFTQYILSQTEEWIKLQKPLIGGFYPFDAIGLAGLLYPELITKKEFMRLEINLEPDSPNWSFFVPSLDISRPVAEIWFDIKEDEFLETLRIALGIGAGS